jgi:hypothetical protein
MTESQLFWLFVLCAMSMFVAYIMQGCATCPEPNLLEAVSRATGSTCVLDGPTAFKCLSGHVGSLDGRSAVIYFPAYHAHTALFGTVSCGECECL